MSVSIVNGFICITPGPEEVIKAQKGINPKPGLPKASETEQPVKTVAASNPEACLDAEHKPLDIRA
jgi:hypothetical protein